MTHEKNVFSCCIGGVVLLSNARPMKSLRPEVHGLFRREVGQHLTDTRVL